MLELSDTWPGYRGGGAGQDRRRATRVYNFDVERLTVPACDDEKISLELQSATLISPNHARSSAGTPWHP